MTSYLRKIEAERMVLRTINEKCGADGLHGLSAGAIATWAEQRPVPAAIVKEVAALGRMVGAMCERSGERDSTADRVRCARVARAVRAFVNRRRD